MSMLQIFHEREPERPLNQSCDAEEMAELLHAAGVRFEQWRASQPVVAGAAQEEVFAAYRSDIDRLVSEGGYQTVGLYYQEIWVDPVNPDRVYSVNVQTMVSNDAGRTFTQLGESGKHVDNHALTVAGM